MATTKSAPVQAVKADPVDYKAVKVNILTAFLLLSQAIEVMDADNVLKLSQAMRSINKQWSDRKTKFDAKLGAMRKAGTIVIATDGTGVQPVRAFRADGSATPGRKAAAPKTEAEKLAEAFEAF